LGAPSEKSARVQLLSMVQQQNSFGETCFNHEIRYPGERCPTFDTPLGWSRQLDILNFLPTFTSEETPCFAEDVV
jgi:hypothetical protein